VKKHARSGNLCRDGEEEVFSPAVWRQWRGCSLSTRLEDEEREGLRVGYVQFVPWVIFLFVGCTTI
jgi:hypothetical protein